ncbi:helix-turn-helix domain-containing protein [Shimia aestuarii]|uniref:Helix-turn-helix domain-containing protein n=1 Tax=Shimia aestuarii TaxID=254406 RepID=A0A1I4TIK0_9RHOB|nr:helix-turn-helix domain-containing protein [Shimia aestuarii]SFM76544.1 Helix-turn-helix domain-containing protein [Shimia aestuarii]
MSIVASKWARGLDLKSGPKAVLLALADRLNDTTGRCDPSIKKICADTGLKRTAVKSALKKLAMLGLLTVERRKLKSSRNYTSNQYHLHIGAKPLLKERMSKAPQGVGLISTEVGANSTEGGSVSDHKPKDNLKGTETPSHKEETPQLDQEQEKALQLLRMHMPTGWKN